MDVYALEVGMSAVDEGLRDQVRDRYARAALTVTEVGTTADCCGGGGCGPTVLDEAGEAFGAALYEPDQTSGPLARRLIDGTRSMIKAVTARDRAVNVEVARIVRGSR